MIIDYLGIMEADRDDLDKEDWFVIYRWVQHNRMETPITKLRRRILDVAYRDGMGHIPSAQFPYPLILALGPVVLLSFLMIFAIITP